MPVMILEIILLASVKFDGKFEDLKIPTTIERDNKKETTILW
jgi:hypothetical protein